MKKTLIILTIFCIIILAGCSSSSNDDKINNIEYYQEMTSTYQDLANINDEGLSAVDEFFTIITRIENNEDNIDKYIEDNLKEIEEIGRSHRNFREMIIGKAETGIWDNRDMMDMVLILDNIETALEVIDESYINVKEYNEGRDKEASNIYIIMMDVGIIQDLLLDNEVRAEENQEVFYYRIQNHKGS